MNLSERLPMREQLRGGRATFARFVLRVMMWRLQPYQPVLVNGRLITRGLRGTDERLQAVLEICEQVEARSVLDLGCAEGYMVRSCAESGRFALGVDADASRLLVAQQSLILDGVTGFGFIRADVNVTTIRAFPASDVVVCLSLLHHVMYEHGVDGARSVVAAIKGITNRALVFEMGQSDETEFQWATSLPDMGSDPHAWIADFLRSAGFVSVKKVAEVPSYNSRIARATFVATP